MEVREPSAKYLAKATFKQTEIGEIPADWEPVFVEDYAHITTGGRNTQDRVEDGEYPFFVRSQTVERINSYSFDGEAVLTAGDGVGTGKVFHYIDGRFDAHQRVYRISGFSERLNGYFFYLYFSTHFYGRIMQMTAKSSVDSVRREMIARMQIPLPPTVAEQQAIATALSDADALIESLEQLLTKKRQIKQGAMQELLTGKRRLPGFEGEWIETELGEWGLCHRGVSYNPDRDLSAHDTDTSVRLLRSNNVQRSLVVLDDIQFVSVDRVSGNQRLRRNDVLICMANGSRDLVGKAAQFSVEDGFSYTFGAFMGAFRPNENADPNYVFYCFHSDVFRKHVAILLAGSSINNLTPSSIESCVIRAPLDKEEQTAIATILSDMDADITTLEAKLAKARAIKQGMMQELLTGRVRLV